MFGHVYDVHVFRFNLLAYFYMNDKTSNLTYLCGDILVQYITVLYDLTILHVLTHK